MSNELQPALLISAPSGAFDSHMLVIFAIMLVAGILGGLANYFLADRTAQPGQHDLIKYPVLGVVSALTVPLFLNMISSTLLEGARTKPVDFYVFAGFCLMYVIASRRVFENVAARLLGQVDQVKREMTHLKQRQQEQAAAQLLAEQRAEPVVTKEEPPPAKEALSYNDVEILRALAEESYVYGNLAALCEATGLGRELVSQRLTLMKSIGVLETRINEKNILHWYVSSMGKQVLAEILNGPDGRKVA